jgi:predicted nucleic acid-binding protein
MSHADIPKVFLDSSVVVSLFASKNRQSLARILMTLAREGLIDLRISRDVVREVDGVLEARYPEVAGRMRSLLAETLADSNVGIAGQPADATVEMCVGLTKYRPDALVLAAAIETDCEVLVSYDKQHLLHNPNIGPPNTRLVVMTPEEALDWARDQVITRARERRRRQ